MPTESGPKAKFRLLDIVRASEFSGRGAITQIRLYRNGDYRYSVAPLDDPDEIGTIFDEDQLEGTGGQVDSSYFTDFGLLHIRDVVTISSSSEHPEIVGMRGVVIGGNDDYLSVWIEEAKECWALVASDLESTGERVPPSGPGPSMSKLVSERGELLGVAEYVLLEDVDDL